MCLGQEAAAKLQWVQTSSLWLHVKLQMEFHIITFKALHNLASPYTSELLILYIGRFTASRLSFGQNFELVMTEKEIKTANCWCFWSSSKKPDIFHFKYIFFKFPCFDLDLLCSCFLLFDLCAYILSFITVKHLRFVNYCTYFLQ